MFSERVDFDLRKNQLALLLERRRVDDSAVIDLTESNPTVCGFDYPADRILQAFANPESLVYRPHPRGLRRTREAISNYYLSRGHHIDPNDLLLTASTSEAYSFLFKLLAGPDERLLMPQPSYPLFEYLARIESVQPVAYRLFYQDRWCCDFNDLKAKLDRGVKAVLLVNPNNPTGSYLQPAEWDLLRELCIEHRVALICDEVFFDYPMNAVVTHSDPVREQELLIFVLNGLSKGAGLPQMKLSWILVRGSARQRKESLERLEIIADTFLSVGTPVQHAATVFLEVSAQIRSQILDRIRSNHDFLRKAVMNTAFECLIVEGGWYALLRLPKTRSEEGWVCHFLEKREVLVHPGYFYGFSEQTFAVLSLLPKQAEFQEGVGRLLSGLE